MSRIARWLEQMASPVPLIGIGGITSANLGEVMRAGAAGVAVITSLLASPDPGEETRTLKRAMLEAWTPGGPDAPG
jgi:thiamine monophosphate synthase